MSSNFASCTFGSDTKTISGTYCYVLGAMLSTYSHLILTAALSHGAVDIIVPVWSHEMTHPRSHSW